MTEAEQHEIVTWLATHPTCRYRIDIGNAETGEGWMIILLDKDGAMRGGMHPRTFLDVIREVTDADTLTKDTQQENRSTEVVGDGAVEGKPNEAAPVLFRKDGLHRGD